jgi:hypothetical protein
LIWKNFGLKNDSETLKYLRTIRKPDIVDAWVGDSLKRLVGRLYTHFLDKFMINQMDLVQFEF